MYVTDDHDLDNCIRILLAFRNAAALLHFFAVKTEKKAWWLGFLGVWKGAWGMGGVLRCCSPLGQLTLKDATMPHTGGAASISVSTLSFYLCPAVLCMHSGTATRNGRWAQKSRLGQHAGRLVQWPCLGSPGTVSC